MKIIGIIFILTGVLMTNSLISLKKKMNHCSSYASGKIISVESYTRFKGLRIRKYYIPTIEFTDNNITYTVKFPPTYDPEEYSFGESVWVMYNPRNPNEVTQQDDIPMYNSKVKAVIGVWIIFAGVLIVVFT